MENKETTMKNNKTPFEVRLDILSLAIQIESNNAAFDKRSISPETVVSIATSLCKFVDTPSNQHSKQTLIGDN